MTQTSPWNIVSGESHLYIEEQERGMLGRLKKSGLDNILLHLIYVKRPPYTMGRRSVVNPRSAALAAKSRVPEIVYRDILLKMTLIRIFLHILTNITYKLG